MHQQFVPEIASKRLINDLFIVSPASIGFVCLGSLLPCPFEDVYFRVFFITISALAALLVGLTAVSETRKIVKLW